MRDAREISELLVVFWGAAESATAAIVTAALAFVFAFDQLKKRVNKKLVMFR